MACLKIKTDVKIDDVLLEHDNREYHPVDTGLKTLESIIRYV